MPSARALRVMARANSSSLPPSASAITTAASLADLVTRPLIASSTLSVSPGRRPSLVGAWIEASSDTSIGVSSVILPDSSRSNSR